MRVIYNEGRVVGLSTYELYVRSQLAAGVDPSDIPSEAEWIINSMLVARGGSMILTIPANTSAGCHDYTLPQGTTLVPGAPMYATLFEGEVTPVSSNSVWAAHITDNGRLISNTSTRHPETPGRSGNVPAKTDTSVPASFTQQCIEYMKVDSMIAVQPGEWTSSEAAAPAMKLAPDFTETAFVRVLLSEATTAAIPILISGFISTEIIKAAIQTESFSTAYTSGQALGPAVFPWTSKIEVLVTSGPLKEYLNWYVPSTFAVYYHIDTSNVVSKDIEDGTDAIIQAPSATKTGWTFVGWREDDHADPNVLSSLVVSTSGIHLYAVFQQTVTVTLSGGDAPGSSSGLKYYNNNNTADPSITLSAVSKSGWTLVGYRNDQTASSSTDYSAGSAYTFSASRTIYAVFTSVVTLYTTIKGQQVAHPGDRYYNSGSYTNPTISVADPTLTGANFLGYSDSGSSTAVVTPSLASGITISEDTYRYAVWKYNDGTIYDGPGITHGGYLDHNYSDPAILYNMYSFDGTKYASVVVSMTADLYAGGSWVQNPAWVDLVNQDMVATCNAYYPSHVPGSGAEEEWAHPLFATAGQEQGTFKAGPCNNGNTGTIICNCPNTNPYTLQGSLGGWVSSDGNREWSGLTVIKIVGTGRTVVY